MNKWVDIRWVTVCINCSRKHVETQNCDEGVKFSPPPVPRECEGCSKKLRDERYSWVREFEVVGIHDLGGEDE